MNGLVKGLNLENYDAAQLSILCTVFARACDVRLLAFPNSLRRGTGTDASDLHLLLRSSKSPPQAAEINRSTQTLDGSLER